MFFSVFDEPLQSFKRKIAHNNRDEPDLCQHITDNLAESQVCRVWLGTVWCAFGRSGMTKKICTDEWCLKVMPLRNSGEKAKLLAQDLRDASVPLADTW